MNFQEYLASHGQQREDLLARIAQSLELDESRSERMKSAYNAIYDLLKKDLVYFSTVDFTVYPQGSTAIGTTTKPLGENEFDLDIVVQIEEPYTKYTSYEIYNHLIRVLTNDETYRAKTEKKNRCARINYSGDFHMDVLPGCIIISGEDRLKVPDRILRTWTSSYPKGYKEWFLTKADAVLESSLQKVYSRYLVEAKSEQEDLPDNDYYTKKPLKRAVQLVKRYRDIYFAKHPEHQTSSIILTTLFGQLYNGDPTIYGTIDFVLNQITDKYYEYQYLFESQGISKRIQVLNPVDSEEDFTEKWDTEPEYYRQFISFMKSFKEKWALFKENKLGVAEELFGSTRTKTIIKEQLENLAKSKNHPLEKSAIIAFSNRSKYDKDGNPNEDRGYLSKPNRNFGGEELFPRNPEIKPAIEANIICYIQKHFIDSNFPWLTTFVSEGKLYAKGTIKPSGCKKTYEVLLVYNPTAEGRQEFVYVKNAKEISFEVTPHLYRDNSLCLYYPPDMPKDKPLNLVDIIPWISKWLITYELWKKYGVWLADEIKH